MKNFILAIIFAFLTINLSAQSFRQEGKLYGGLKVGGNLFKITEGKLKYDFGFQVGGLLGNHITNSFTADVEFLISTRNTEFHIQETEETICIKNIYLSFPLLAKYYAVNCFYIHTGLEFGFNLVAKAYIKNFDQLEEKYQSTIGRNEKNIFSISGILGFGFDITKNIFVDARYAHSFNNFFKVDTYVSNKFYMFQLGTGFIF